MSNDIKAPHHNDVESDNDVEKKSAHLMGGFGWLADDDDQPAAKTPQETKEETDRRKHGENFDKYFPLLGGKDGKVSKEDLSKVADGDFDEKKYREQLEKQGLKGDVPPFSCLPQPIQKGLTWLIMICVGLGWASNMGAVWPPPAEKLKAAISVILILGLWQLPMDRASRGIQNVMGVSSVPRGAAGTPQVLAAALLSRPKLAP